MAKPLQATTIANCACGHVALEAMGAPITSVSVSCYCDDCQEGARQIQSLPNAAPVQYLNFDDSKHWLNVYRSRCHGSVPPVQMLICTRFGPESVTIPTDVPGYPRYPISLLMQLIIAKAAMLLHR